jgi:hypothetical protein
MTSPNITIQALAQENPFTSRAVVLTNENGTAKDSRPTPTEGAIEHNGERLVNNNIAEQKCDKNPVFPFLQQLIYLLCMPLFFAFSGLRNDL